ncbi:MAG: toxin-antitoxin system TumE family protein [Janthinobacterium lividum]
MDLPEYALEWFLAYDGRNHVLTSGHFLRFEVRAVAKSRCVPHGVAYSFTLHAPNGQRLLGFDNAHPVAHKGGRFVKPPAASDHWHRTSEDEGRPYAFSSVEQLFEDYFSAVEKTLRRLDIPFVMIEERQDEK